MSLKFKCPKCQCEDLEIVETDVIMSSKVVEIDEDLCFEYDLLECDGGYVDRFQCFNCGLVLKNEQQETITQEEDVVKWIRENCPQENND